jgi:hypothetical protein
MNIYYKKFLSFISQESPLLYRKTILWFLFTCLIVIGIVSYDKSAVHKCYEIMVGDWLINYSAGFIRRGLMGSIILEVSNITAIRPALLVAILKILSYSVIYLSAIYIIAKAKTFKIAHAFLFTYQSSFMFPLLDFRGSGRKEILLLALFSVFSIKNESKLKNSSLILLSFSFLLLTFFHDALFWFYPLILLCLSKIFPHENLSFKNCLFILAPSVISTFIIIRYGTKMNFETLNVMTKAIDPEKFKLWSDSITYVTWDFNDQLHNLLKHLKVSSVINLSFTLFLTYLPIHIITKIDNHILFKNKNFLYWMIACLLFQAPLIMAIDWGRWIYVDSTILSLTYFISLNKKMNLNKNFQAKIAKINSTKVTLTLLILLLFIFTWRVHHCCATGFELTIIDHFKYLLK